MTGPESLAAREARPAIDSAARASEARRLHHRQMIRRGLLAALLVAIVGLIFAVAVPAFNQLRVAWLLQAAGYNVDWQVDELTWRIGGVTSVRYNNRNWLTTPRDAEILLLPRLLNVQSLSLAECPVTEAGLAPLAALEDLRALDLKRLDQFHYGTDLRGLKDSCLTPLVGLRKLESLTLSGNRISDAGLATIGRMTQLSSLDLDATDVTDAGLVHLHSLRNLRSLSLGGTQVTPEGLKAFQKAMPEVEVNFDLSPEVEQAILRLEESLAMSVEFAAAGLSDSPDPGRNALPLFSIRPAVPEDAQIIANLVYELAVYEKLEMYARATADDFRRHLFGPRPYAEAVVAEVEGQAVGFALYFPTFSTFRGQPGLYLEDIFVRPEQRGRGIGKALLATLARLALDRGLGRLEWAVLHWNTPAIGFYQSLGARPMQEWQVYRIDDLPLARLAALAPPVTPRNGQPD